MDQFKIKDKFIYLKGKYTEQELKYLLGIFENINKYYNKPVHTVSFDDFISKSENNKLQRRRHFHQRDVLQLCDDKFERMIKEKLIDYLKSVECLPESSHHREWLVRDTELHELLVDMTDTIYACKIQQFTFEIGTRPIDEEDFMKFVINLFNELLYKIKRDRIRDEKLGRKQDGSI